MINLTSIFVSNGFGLASLLTTAFCNTTLLRTKRKDIRYIWIIILITIIACIVDPIVFYADGRSGALCHWIIVLGNTYLFTANAWLGILWIAFLVIHLHGISHGMLRLVNWLCIVPGILTALGVINLFVPIIFEVNEANVYRRLPFSLVYWIYMGVYLSISVVLYFVYHHMSIRIQYFPIGVFISPIVIGALIQGVYYGVSLTWPSVAVAVSGVMMCIKSEVAYVDQLTGLNNRNFLFSTDFYQKMNGAIMLDINSFKSINDTYGHSEGDAALTLVAETIAQAVAGMGFAVRYAGDEFIVFSLSGAPEALKMICDNICRALDDINKSGKKPYTLGVSCGAAPFDRTKQTIDELIYVIDQRMYEEKRRYYAKEHDRRREQNMVSATADSEKA